MEKLTIELDCNEETCGKCKIPTYTGKYSQCICSLFDKALPGISGFNFEYKRLPECIAACKA